MIKVTVNDSKPLQGNFTQVNTVIQCRVLYVHCAAGDVPEWLKLSKNTVDIMYINTHSQCAAPNL